jgi:complement component 1 Q subcomponent-binding protein, mitochondrial
MLVEKRLAGLLKEEHRFETESATKAPEHIQSFIQKYGWIIQDQDNCMDIVLRKTIGPEEIMVTFSASQIDESELTVEEEEEMQGGYREEKPQSLGKEELPRGQTVDEDIDQVNEDEDLPYGMEELDFMVMVKKQNDKPALLFDCIAINGTVEIESLRYLPDGTLVNASDIKATRDRSNSYQGPIMSTLESKVQEAFFDYLETRSVDENLAVFIRDYIAFKEQKEYVRWLENVQKFISVKH